MSDAYYFEIFLRNRRVFSNWRCASFLFPLIIIKRRLKIRRQKGGGGARGVRLRQAFISVRVFFFLFFGHASLFSSSYPPTLVLLQAHGEGGRERRAVVGSLARPISSLFFTTALFSPKSQPLASRRWSGLGLVSFWVDHALVSSYGLHSWGIGQEARRDGAWGC